MFIFFWSLISPWTRNKSVTVNGVQFHSFIDANDKESHQVQKVAIGQGPTVFAVGAGSCFSLSLSFQSLLVWSQHDIY